MEQLPDEVRERLENMVQAPFAAMCGMELVSLGPRTARVRLELEGRQNALGGMHGGALFSLADQAFALAANQGENIYVAMCASIHYIRPARGTVEAESRLIGESGRTAVFEVRIFQGDELVAIFQGTGYRLAKKHF